MSSNFRSTIGILGGTGPAATAYAFNRLISLCQDVYGTIQDSDFPNVVVTSIPIQGMDEFGFDETTNVGLSLKRQLELSSAAIKKAGADIVYMACNTLHGYVDILTAAGLSEVSIIATSADYVQASYPRSKVAVLSSQATRREKLYEDVLIGKGLDFHQISDDVQESVNAVILSAMGGKNLVSASKKLQELISTLLETVDCVILGCTELSLLTDQRKVEKNSVIDAQEIALRELLGRSR